MQDLPPANAANSIKPGAARTSGQEFLRRKRNRFFAPAGALLRAMIS